MMRLGSMIGGAALLLAGCVPPTPAPPGAAMTRAEPRPGVTPPLASGEAQLVVRAVPAGVPREELVGASCRAESPYFTASFTAPAVVLLPDYGSAQPPVTVTCRSGTTSGTAVAQPEAVWQRGMGGWPAVGVSVGTGDVSGVGVGLGWYGGGVGTQSGRPVVRYPELRVPLS
jgi:hypothetical protein